MSDHWEVFPCQIGEHQAFVAYDHGLSETIDGLGPTSLLKIKVSVKSPDENGLPQRDEFPALDALEDRLGAAVAAHGGTAVGRVTVAGLRIFYYYIDIAESEARALIAAHADRSGYELRFTLKQDAGREGYWQDLYPSDDERQIAADLRVVEALEQRGDDLSQPRKIEHWAYFQNAEAMERFVKWLRTRRFEIESATQVDPQDTVDAEHRYRVQFHHELAPSLDQICPVTVELCQKTRELGGDYDGWETRVVAAAPAD